MKKFLVALMLMIFGVANIVCAAPDTQVDALIAKLIEKGILNQEEADVLKGQVAYDAKEIQAVNMKKDIPEWVQNTKLSGDFRIRNQYEHRKNSASTLNGRNRVRMRARLGVETKINDAFKMAVGIATDGGGARSSNYTFDSTFAKGSVVLNYAYGQWTPNSEWKLTAGQMKNPIWEPMEFLWDGDITPQGGAIEYSKKLSDYLKIDVLGSGFVVKELALSNADPYLWVGQVEASGMLFTEKFDYHLAGTYQYLQNNNKATFGSSSNNTFQASKYKYNYNTPMAALELGLNDPFGENFPVYVPRIAVFGEFAYNPQPKDENKAWMAGVYMGNAKVSSKGAWKMAWAYKSLGKDAWLDALPDSDFYGGSTDTQGYEGIIEYGLAKNITLGIDYYHTQRKSSLSAPQAESIIQTDINWKF
jgi:hypothetical protein